MEGLAAVSWRMTGGGNTNIGLQESRSGMCAVLRQECERHVVAFLARWWGKSVCRWRRLRGNGGQITSALLKVASPRQNVTGWPVTPASGGWRYSVSAPARAS